MSSRPFLYSKIVRSSEAPKLIRFLIKNRIVRTETQALIFLIFVVVIATTLAVYFCMSIDFKSIMTSSLDGINYKGQ